jgi:hypothetical protein
MISKLLIFFVFLAVAGTAHGADKLWVGLYLGENKPAQVNAAPEKLAHRLRAVFGFRQYELLQGEEVNLRNNWDHWILSRKDFFMRIQSVPHAPGEDARIDYEIYKDGFLIAKGRYQVNDEIPLFINGPDFRQGRLIFVVEAR